MKTNMTVEIQEMLDKKLQDATDRYIKKNNALFKAYRAAKTASEKEKIAKQISRLGKAYTCLRENYAEAFEAILYDLGRYVIRYDDYFEAKLKNEPHEWD